MRQVNYIMSPNVILMSVILGWISPVHSLKLVSVPYFATQSLPCANNLDLRDKVRLLFLKKHCLKNLKIAILFNSEFICPRKTLNEILEGQRTTGHGITH